MMKPTMTWFIFTVSSLFACTFTNIAFANNQTRGRQVVLNTMADLKGRVFSQHDVFLVNPDIGDEKTSHPNQVSTQHELAKFLAGKQLMGITHRPDEGYYYEFKSPHPASAQGMTSVGQGSVHGSFINSKLMRLMEESRLPQ